MAPRRTLLLVLNHNGRDLLRACLASLREFEGSTNVRVVVSDNGSTDGSAEMTRAEFPWVAFESNGENLGFSRGNNRILATYEADAYVLLNNDTEARSGWLDVLLKEAEDPSVGIVGPKLRYPDGRIQHAGGVVDALGPRHRRQFDADDVVEPAMDVDYLTFAAALVKREVVERIGYLDEAYSPIYYEDVDYCLRARSAGFRMRYASASVLVHKENATTSREPDARRLRIAERNRLRFKAIHYPASWWLRGTWSEMKTLAGNARKGRLGVLLGAWRDNARDLRAIRERRRARAAFVSSEFAPVPGKHAPVVPWPQSAR